MSIPKLLPPYSCTGEFHKSAKKVPSSPTILTPDRKSLSHGQLYPDQLIICSNPFLTDVVGEIREDQPGNKQLVAYVVVNEKLTIAIHDLRNSLRQKLPDYMSPSAFIVLESLPITPNGKIDGRALPPPDIKRVDLEDSSVAPQRYI